ncbi:HipA domain-containing protein [Burkholderia multivorans]|uniref:HipA domain-containing protein n=1 Tax=Burkholderia multivorans TaxID=87883 RepID=A0AAP2HR93_9BURK|nr:HipA domain-containing protein [Burkholderia multivorans]MBU9360445.1 HipA domain-containing protein [Burkholderia multivorans]MBU9365450.1 HipA domain-containing protein [Burkholderia multivorans]MBU9597710.1 HipA domain-containing protein [Burkholderia multivorans]MCA8457406.1 HipA domain-containing protein [Burkholderia multivorans]MCA8487676.1 HipA domain-containing protein [Burkholderia multivorans]
MTERALIAAIGAEPIGTLHENRNLWAFEYAPSWLAHPARFALSPHLPLQADMLRDGATTRPVQWYFDNLLPEEAVRALLARDAGLPDIGDAFALLEHYGRESAGSVTLRLPDDAADDDTTLRPLDAAALDARIRALPAVPLTHDAPKKMSLAGAQHKLPVVLRDGRLFEPSGQAVSTHILKPNHPHAHDYPHSVVNEWFVMTLARRVGLDVPDVERRYVPAPVYVIRRFDRIDTDAGVERRHAIDGCQVLNLPATMKYTGWSLDALAALANACRAPAPVRLRIFRWLVFCVIVGNGDSHLKNLSFIVGDSGLTLAPHYDLLCDSVYETAAYSARGRWPDLTEFTRPVAGVQRYADFTRDVLERAGAALGLTRATAQRHLDTLVAQIPAHADALLAEVARDNDAMRDARPELTATLGGEMHLLRAIRHIVIQEMVERLRPR